MAYFAALVGSALLGASVALLASRLAGCQSGSMCRNITTLRGLEPVATNEEIEAAARQYVRKVTGVQKTSANTEQAFERAVAIIAEATDRVLGELPPRKMVPKTEPPLRRMAR